MTMAGTFQTGQACETVAPVAGNAAKSVDGLAGEQFDLIITVCDQAQEQCPLFPGETEGMHVGFPDVAKAIGTEAEIMAAFRQVREVLIIQATRYHLIHRNL
jgi:protein-tyrosine-phosphatase